MFENWLSKIETNEDPMALVQAARARGVEPKLTTGYDPAGGGLVVAWYIPDTEQFVIEGIRVDPSPSDERAAGA